VEKDRMGGTCTNDGCVPTRVLAKAARLVRDAQQFDEYAISGDVRGFDLEALLSRTQQIVYRVHEKKQLIEHLQDVGVDVLSEVGPARFHDAHTVSLPDGRQLQAQKFILCAGGSARRIDFPGSDYALTHHDVWSMTALPASIAIVGGAATGCQLASIFSAFGAKVSLLEVAPRILAAEDEIISSTIHDVFCRRDIDIHCGIQGVDSIEKTADGLRLHFRRDDALKALDVQAVILAVGWVGYGDALNVAAAGIETHRGYVPVNDYLQSSVPHIYAAGDLNGRMMLVQSASYEARVAVENAILNGRQRNEHEIVPHGGFTDPEYGSVGLTEAQAREAHDCLVATVPYSDIDRAVIDGYTDGYCKLIISAETHRILGAHVVGEQAVEVVQMIAAGMAADMWVEQLAELELAYPTYTAIVGIAARQLVRQLGVVPLVPEWRSLQRVRLRDSEWERSAG
jgi:dihydrolipoamide dehydrogenase